MAKKRDSSTLLENRKAHFLYFLSDFMVAGLVLTGTEIKSLRARNASLSDSYVYVRNREAYIANMHIAPYKDGTVYNVDHLRDRKLLLNRREIDKLDSHLKGSSCTCVPTKVFLKNGFAKVEIALAKGKQAHDKREAIKKRDDQRAMDRGMKEGRKADV
ncbi:MAG: SsrA-binding protein SmpB [Firmicutes bacterium]|uniref:SsrA-binding protein n=1 Tax=Candidatus Alloenteromonas pullistercoris TaxID=2840785 RepID=A0A9D9DI39_9FIRM|nr:SsrA-binding protein SmpB [Candidatus Enteromonas pullistercoris]